MAPLTLATPPVTVTVVPAGALPVTAIVDRLVMAGKGVTLGAAGGATGAAEVWNEKSCTPFAAVDSAVPQPSCRLFVRRTTIGVEYGRLACGVNVSVLPTLVRPTLPAISVPPETSPLTIVAPANTAKLSFSALTGSTLNVDPLMLLVKLRMIGVVTNWPIEPFSGSPKLATGAVSLAQDSVVWNVH